jgi:hypothetical protein
VLTVALREFDGFAGSLAKKIQFRTSCFAASNRRYIDNIRRMKREYTLYAFIIYNSAYGESFVDSTAFAGNYRSGKDLNPFFIAFFNPATHIDRIAYLEMRYVLLQILTFYSVKYLCFHFICSRII